MPFTEMTREIEDSEGNIHNYYVRQLPASASVPLQFRLFSVVESVIPVLLEKVQKFDFNDPNTLVNNRTEILKEFLGLLGLLFSKNDADTLFTLIKDIVYKAKRDGKIINDGNFDIIYSGNDMEMYKALFFVLEVNFSNFIKGLKENPLFDSMPLAKAATSE